ncbi:hypothetical protein Rs2_17528 [Raphanus sativus]|uniref:Uncharacterized protein LOC108849630 n=1 Tax=Raphanus sativus TaxID=3726 RepID=A0A9W3DG34_RAPSA|nr:uncharacterized protein LOC108849630 [Raphanus sativus]XP_056862785.1 uncharacterized protein LOC108849630 [Raphanus sativus]KAJ4903577.1 hypothetical protein Rs2_17528 [Raphanus sativus]
MPSGAKKRKALKKKKEQEAFGGGSPSNKGFNGHGYDEHHGSQDEGESDGNLSSPGSQGNGEVWTRDPSPSPLSGLRKDTFKEKTEGQEAKGEDVAAAALGRGTCHEEKNGVNGKAASKEAGGGGTLEIAPADDASVKPVDSSVSEVMITNKNGHAESSTDSASVQHKADESQEKRRLEETNEGNITGSAAETSQVPECSEEKSHLPSGGPPVARTSWFSCCGLFDVMAGSER